MTRCIAPARSPLSVLLFLLLSTGCQVEAPAPADAGPVEDRTGRLVSAGGALSPENEDVYREILDAREGDGPVCVIPTAGASPERSMESAVSRFDAWGGEGTARGILISEANPEAALDPEVAVRIRACSGFFFTGGSQSRVTNVFLPDGVETPAYRALMDRFGEGAVVSGSSAGAAMMSDPMIAGGSSAGAFRAGLNLGHLEEGVRIRQGMGFLDFPIMDQHFLARGRIGRLLVAVAQLDGVPLGVGIDENTALVVDGSVARSVGASGVVLVDGSAAAWSRRAPAEIEGVRLELLGHGDEVDLETGELRPAPDKEDLPAELASGETVPDGDLFDRWVFLHLLHRLARSEADAVTVPVEGYELELRKGPGFRALAYPGEGVEGTPFGLSVGPVEVAIRTGR